MTEQERRHSIFRISETKKEVGGSNNRVIETDLNQVLEEGKIYLPYNSDDVLGLEIHTEIEVTAIIKPKAPTVIERLRRNNPGRNICSVAVSELDQPDEMTQFVFQYAQELGRTSEIPETRANPYDTAVKLIDRMATLHGREIADRWHEFIDTGTLQNVPDHSLDWITPEKNQK